jgi:hypothetical protein
VEACIGLAGAVLGSVVTGLLAFFLDRQRGSGERETEDWIRSRCVRDSDAYGQQSKGEHMNRLLALGALTAVAVALSASPAIADAPPGQGLETFTVDCAETEIPITVVGTVGDSASRWIDDQHMVLLSISFEADGVTITQGKKTGLAANAVSCTVTDQFGTATVVRAPVPPGG